MDSINSMMETIKRNYKIYVLFLGMIMALAIYSQMNIDFSFYVTEYDFSCFRRLFFLTLFHDLKIWGVFYLLSRLKYKRVILVLLTLYLGYLIGAIVMVSYLWKCKNIWSRIFMCTGLWFFIHLLFEKKKSKKIYFVTANIFLLSILFQVFMKIIF